MDIQAITTPNVAVLRERGLSWTQIAVKIREQYGVSALVAARLAHGWTQAQVAGAWNKRWPKDPKSQKNLSYWEKWPGSTGYAPSLGTLVRLAEVYECAVADLLAGVGDYRSLDEARPEHRGLDEESQTRGR